MIPQPICRQLPRSTQEGDTEGVVHTSPGQRPGFTSPTTMEALKARLISQAPRIFALSIPDVPLVEGHVIFPQQLAVFLLEAENSTVVQKLKATVSEAVTDGTPARGSKQIRKMS